MHPRDSHCARKSKESRPKKLVKLRNESISRNFTFLDSVSVDKDGVDQDIKVIKLDRNKLNHQVYYFSLQNYTKNKIKRI